MLRNARKHIQKSDESAYSIVPSRMSSRLSTSTNQGLSSDDNMSYRRLSFEDDLSPPGYTKEATELPLFSAFSDEKSRLNPTLQSLDPEKGSSGQNVLIPKST